MDANDRRRLRVTVCFASRTEVNISTSEWLGLAFNWSAFMGEATAREVINARYYFFNGQRIATHKSGVLTYLCMDLLGITVLVTDASGNVIG